MLNRLALVAAAVLLVPVVAYTDANTSSRIASASVAADAASYLKAVKSDVTLGLANAYTATFLTLTHDYATGTTLDVAFTKTGGNARFTITPASGPISTIGGTLSATVTDTATLHTPITDTLTVRVDATIKNGASNVGFITYSRSVTVRV